MTSTHDHALTQLTGFDNAHFSKQVTADGLAFDHLLKPGAASTTNALALLRFLKFPEEVVIAAERSRAAAGTA